MAESGNFPDLATFYNDEVPLRSHAIFKRVPERGVESGAFRNLDPVQSAQIIVAPLLMLLM